MHIEEIVEQGTKPDSTAGMMRFLTGHFKPVVNKILPDGPPDEIRALLEEDPDYFNDLVYDDVVESIANLMLVSGSLFVKNQMRADEDGDRGRYSEVKGVHFMPWNTEVRQHFRETFNEMADTVRSEARASKDEGEGGDEGKVRKDMTRVLQFMPPLDVIEKVCAFLLAHKGHSTAQQSQMSGEEIVHALASASNDIEKTLGDLDVVQIPAEVTKHAVDGALAVGEWFSQCYKMTLEARAVVAKFRSDRSALASLPPPTVATATKLISRDVVAHVDPLKTLARTGLALQNLRTEPLHHDRSSSGSAVRCHCVGAHGPARRR